MNDQNTKPIDLTQECEFSLGALTFVPSLREIRSARGAERVEPRVMQALVCLARAQGAVVSRDQLVQACWAGRAVSEDAINRCIAKLRQVGGSGDSAAFVVETVPRVGYRLMPGAIDTAPVADAVKSGRVAVCVMPFANLSDDPEQGFLADGITADIITDLARWPTLAVASRNAAAHVKDQHGDVPTMARALGVRFVVEGSVRQFGERIRITAQLIDGDTGSTVWAERYDRPAEDFFAVQDEVVRTIVGTLVGRVFTSEAARLRRNPPSCLAAYELMLRGNALHWDDPHGAAEAKRVFREAITLDPAYGLAYSLLAAVTRRGWEKNLSPSQDTLEEAFCLALRGVELATDESTSHAILGSLYMYRRAYDLAERHYERAWQINPANHWNLADFGEMLTFLGKAEEGLEKIRSARRMDPYLGASWYWRALGATQFTLRNYTEALSDFDQAGGNPPAILGMMAGCCVKLGDRHRAHALIQQAFAGFPMAAVSDLMAKVPFRQQSDADHMIECLKLAGAPG